MTAAADRARIDYAESTGTAKEGVSRTLATFASDLRFAALPTEVVSKCKLLVLDCMGNQIGAYGQQAPTLVHETIGQSLSGPSTVVGWGTKASPTDAALVNGTLAHTLDMDDAHRDSLTKTGSAITPAALAMAEAVGAKGTAVIEAVVAGYEVMIRLGLAVNPSHRRRGFHSTATLGVFGAAAAAGRLLNLDAERMANAFGIAGTQSSGLTAFINTPSMTKPLNVGRAVQCGVFSAILAGKGFTGPTDILESAEGFLRAYTDAHDVTRLTALLGDRYHIPECGFKPHAACRYAHGPIDAALELMAAHRFEAEDIASIDVHLSELAFRQAHFYEPANVSSAQGSAPFSIAAGISRRARSLTFAHIQAAFEDKRTWDLHRRVLLHVDKSMDYMGRGCRLLVRLSNGNCHEAVVNLPRGEPENPMSADEVRAKFESQAAPIVGRTQVLQLAAMVTDLERQSSLAALMELTRADR